jgi:hypothetical protein
MIESHLKSLSEEYGFKYNHLNKILSVNLEPPFFIQYKDHVLKFFGFLPQINSDKMDEGLEKLMQLNLTLESSENLNIGFTPDEKLVLNSDFFFTLNYKQLQTHIESFANHLDKISSMIQDLNKQN